MNISTYYHTNNAAPVKCGPGKTNKMKRIGLFFDLIRTGLLLLIMSVFALFFPSFVANMFCQSIKKLSQDQEIKDLISKIED